MKISTTLLFTLIAPCLGQNYSLDDLFEHVFNSGQWWPDLVARLVPPHRQPHHPPHHPSHPSSHAFKPTAGATWNIELNNVPSKSKAKDSAFHIWDFDMADAPKSTIDAFHEKGHRVICYFSAGTWEKWRDDAHRFPEHATGKALADWPGEKYVDVRNHEIRDIMRQRIQQASRKGCDGIDPDNIDGYENDSGFDLTKDDAVDYIHFLAATAHRAGMSYGLKNGGAIVDRVVDVSQWCVNEQCAQYNECGLYQPFIKQNKPVFHLEYTEKDPPNARFVKKACKNPKAKGFSTLIKHENLNGWTTTCP